MAAVPSKRSAATSGATAVMRQIERLPLAAVHYQRGFDIDAVLLSACAQLSIRGVRVGGFVQSSSTDSSRCDSSVHLIDLRSGEAFDIWDARGACARGCRLDERGLVDTEPNLWPLSPIASICWSSIVSAGQRAWDAGCSASSRRGSRPAFLSSRPCGIPTIKLGNNFMVDSRKHWRQARMPSLRGITLPRADAPPAPAAL